MYCLGSIENSLYSLEFYNLDIHTQMSVRMVGKNTPQGTGSPGSIFHSFAYLFFFMGNLTNAVHNIMDTS